MPRNPPRARRNLFLLSCALSATACEQQQPAEPTFAAPEGPRLWSQVVGHPWERTIPGGTPQNAYVTEPTSQTISNVATATIVTNGVVVNCQRGGYGRVHVLTGNGYWYVYDLTCYWEDQGGG